VGEEGRKGYESMTGWINERGWKAVREKGKKEIKI
jgi:hypothetical protein